MALGAQDDATLGTPGSQRAARNAQLYATLANASYGLAGAGLLTVIIALSFEDANHDAFALAPTLSGNGVSVVGTW